jgi:transcriptional regulator with XRE-family HTH domain
MQTSLGERLRRAVEEVARISVREFQRQMEALGVKGSSYPNIHRYLSDRSEPSLEFLRSAAEKLGVRYEWLTVDDGEPTEEAETRRRLRDGIAHGAEHVRSLMGEVGQDICSELGRDVEGVPFWLPPLFQLYVTSGWTVQVGRALGHTLTALGIQAERMSEDDFGDFALSMLPALFFAARWEARERERGRRYFHDNYLAKED